MAIKVAFDNLRAVYTVRKLSTDHTHPHGPNEYQLYSSERQPTGVLRDQTIAMLANGANPTLVADSLNEQGLKTRATDLYNLKQSTKFKGICVNCYLM